MEIMKPVRAKKHLGQHFLTDLNIAQKIADTLKGVSVNRILEIGPGMGVLTQFLYPYFDHLHLIEIDSESVVYLREHFDLDPSQIHEIDFLKLNLNQHFPQQSLAVIGNFPYNISSQIVFKVLENRDQIPFFAGMFQKEVAQRLTEKPGSKTYGILSVLCQLFYQTDYLFSVPPGVFNPPPKVDSGVIQMHRKENFKLNCDEALLFKVVKTSFQQRRKTLRNSLKSLQLSKNLTEGSIFAMRPEQLSGEDFVTLTQQIQHGQFSN